MISTATALVLAAIAISCGGQEAVSESWPVDEFFEGVVGDSLGDNGAVRWFRMQDDQTWAYGSRGCDDAESVIAAGTWDFSEPGSVTEIELFMPDGEDFPGSLGASATKRLFLRYDGCDGAELVTIQSAEQISTYSRGVACVAGCVSSGASKREIKWCDVGPSCD